MLGSHAVLTGRQEGFAMHFSDEAPDSKTGLIIGDLTSRRFSGHEGRGTGKKTTPGGREKHAFFSEAEESSGNKLV